MVHCVWWRESAAVHHGTRRATPPTRHVLLLLAACLLLLSVAWSGLTCPALAAEEAAGIAEGHSAPSTAEDMAPVASAEAVMDAAHTEVAFDQRGDFNDVVAAEEAAVITTTTSTNTVTSAAVDGEGSPDLDSFSEEELKALLSEKKKGQVNLKRYKSREGLVNAIRDVEKKEQAQRAFREEVAAAARWYAETQEEIKYQRAAARRAKSSRIRHEGEVPATLRHSGANGNGDSPMHELHILYSEANGYGKNFAALVKDLESSETVRLPNLDTFRIVGEPYPISRESAILGQVLQVCFYGVLALAVVPDFVPFIPEAGRNMIRTRRGLVISTAFMLNMLGRSVIQNNAFEVHLDGELIYSTIKLAGRLPTSEMVSNMLLERTLLKDYAAAMGRE